MVIKEGICAHIKLKRQMQNDNFVSVYLTEVDYGTVKSSGCSPKTGQPRAFSHFDFHYSGTCRHTCSFLCFFISDDLTRPNVDKLSITAQKLFGNAIDMEPVKDTVEMIKAFHSNDNSNTENPDVETEHVKAETLVARTRAADDSYFSDAVFIGDSISVGLRVYGVLPTQNVIAEQNVNIMNLVNDTPVYRTSGTEKKTVFQAIAEKVPDPDKIYILIGANGIPGLTNEAHINYYGKFLDRLHQTYPDAMIYVETVTPITKDSEYVRDSFNMEKINDFNERLYKLAQEKGVYYLNVQEGASGR